MNIVGSHKMFSFQIFKICEAECRVPASKTVASISFLLYSIARIIIPKLQIDLEQMFKTENNKIVDSSTAKYKLFKTIPYHI